MVYFALLVCCSLGWVLKGRVCAVAVAVCPHKWNTYGNLPQWSVGEGKGESGKIGSSFFLHKISQLVHRFSS